MEQETEIQKKKVLKKKQLDIRMFPIKSIVTSNNNVDASSSLPLLSSGNYSKLLYTPEIKVSPIKKKRLLDDIIAEDPVTKKNCNPKRQLNLTHMMTTTTPHVKLNAKIQSDDQIMNLEHSAPEITRTSNLFMVLLGHDMPSNFNRTIYGKINSTNGDDHQGTGLNNYKFELDRIDCSEKILYDVFCNMSSRIGTMPEFWKFNSDNTVLPKNIIVKYQLNMNGNLFDMCLASQYIKQIEIMLRKCALSTSNNNQPKTFIKIAILHFEEFQPPSSCTWNYMDENDDKQSQSLDPIFSKKVTTHKKSNYISVNYSISTNGLYHHMIMKELCRMDSNDIKATEYSRNKPHDTIPMKNIKDSQFESIQRTIEEQYLKYPKSCEKIYSVLENDIFQKIKMTHDQHLMDLSRTYLLFIDSCIRILKYSIIDVAYSIVNGKSDVLPSIFVEDRELFEILLKHKLLKKSKSKNKNSNTNDMNQEDTDDQFEPPEVNRKFKFSMYSFINNAKHDKVDIVAIDRCMLNNHERLDNYWYYSIDIQLMELVIDVIQWILNKLESRILQSNIQYNYVIHEITENNPWMIDVVKHIESFIKWMNNSGFDSNKILMIIDIFSNILKYSNSDDNDKSAPNYVHPGVKSKILIEFQKYSPRILYILLRTIKLFAPMQCLNNSAVSRSSYSESTRDSIVTLCRENTNDVDATIKGSGIHIFSDRWNISRESSAFSKMMNRIHQHFTYPQYIRHAEAIFIIGLNFGIKYAPILDEKTSCLIEWFLIHWYSGIEKKQKIPIFYYGISNDLWRQCVLKSSLSGSIEWEDARTIKNKHGINDLNVYSNRYLITSSNPNSMNDMDATKIERIIHGIYTTMDFQYQQRQ